MFKKTLLVASITLISNQSFATQFVIGDTLSSPAWTFNELQTDEHNQDNNGADQTDNNDHDSGSDQGGDNDHDSGSDQDGDNDHDSGSDQGGDNDHDSGSDQGGDNDHDSGSDQGGDNDSGSDQKHEHKGYDVSVYGDMNMVVTDCSTVTVTINHTAPDYSVVSDDWTFTTSDDLCNNNVTTDQEIQFTDVNNTTFTLKINANQLISSTLQKIGDDKDKTVFYSPELVLANNGSQTGPL